MNTPALNHQYAAIIILVIVTVWIIGEIKNHFYRAELRQDQRQQDKIEGEQ